MIKSIKVANSYPTSEVGLIAKDISNLYNLEFNTNFSIVILNEFFNNLIKDNAINNKINSLMQSIDTTSSLDDIKEVSEVITRAILKCDFSKEQKEAIMDAYETLPWESSSKAKDLLEEPIHKIDIIASPGYLTKPLILPGIEKDSIEINVKKAYAHFFSVEEINYRLKSNIDNEIVIALIIQAENPTGATVFSFVSNEINEAEKQNLIKEFVFPGLMNIRDLIKHDPEIKPDYYTILKDILKLKINIAGKQKFKTISNNGKYDRNECQINNFILDDSAIIEIARLTKKASAVLEKNVQIIFQVFNNNIKILHVSNTFDFTNSIKEINIKNKTAEDLLTEAQEENKIIIDQPEEFDELKEVENDPISKDETNITKDDSNINEDEEIKDHLEKDIKLENIDIEKEPNPHDYTEIESDDIIENIEEETKTPEAIDNLESEELIQENNKEIENNLEKNNNITESIAQNNIENEDIDFKNLVNSDKPLSELININNSEEKIEDDFTAEQSEEENNQIVEDKEDTWTKKQPYKENNMKETEPISILDEPEKPIENILDNPDNTENILDIENLKENNDNKEHKKEDSEDKEDDFLI